ncbi:LexA family transcriptional regulator [Sphingomonas sp. 3-13AW]|uniref:LexA family transcriptional regulator n=1 Tax=Sphingomonas sp. 3-13AW TaxID=3050450 RepID=UPI003BB699AE
MPDPDDMRGTPLYQSLMMLKPADLPETEWAEKAGVNRSFFSNLKSKGNSPRSDTLRKLLSYIGKTAADLPMPVPSRLTALPSPNAVTFQMEGSGAGRMARDLPVYGTALGADQVVDGEAVEQTMLNTAEVTEYRRRPAILDGRADVYGLYVQGSSMHPRWRDGGIVFVESRRRPAVGDDAVVYLRTPDEHDGERTSSVLIKTLVRKTAAYVELEQYQPPLVFRIPMEQVARMDRVLTLDDLTD